MKSLDIGIISQLSGEDHLQRDGPPQFPLTGLKDNAHSAPRDLAQDFILVDVTDRLTSGEIAACTRR
jgi:hypothetical protein